MTKLRNRRVRFAALSTGLLVAASTGLLVGRPVSGAAPPPAPDTAHERVRADVRNMAGRTADEVAADLRALAPAGEALDEGKLLALASGLVKALSGRPIDDPALVAWIAGDLEQALDPGPDGAEQVKSAISDIGSGLRKAHVDDSLIETVRAALRALRPTKESPAEPRGPEHAYRYALAQAPAYDRSVPIEDFAGRDPLQAWYEPNWSLGISARVDRDAEAPGGSVLTLARVGPFDTYNGFATVLKPPRNIEGMNALRMWIRPCGSLPLGGMRPEARGSVTVGFIDGSDEIWQMEVPDLLAGDEPYVLEIRLADYRRTLRRNNGIIDPEARNVGFWMAGTYRFSVGDIRFVHDEALPEFPAARPGGR